MEEEGEPIEFDDETTEASDDYNTQEGRSVSAAVDAMNNTDEALTDELDQKALEEREAADLKKTIAANQALGPFNKANGTNVTMEDLENEIKDERTSGIGIDW